MDYTPGIDSVYNDSLDEALFEETILSEGVEAGIIVMSDA